MRSVSCSTRWRHSSTIGSNTSFGIAANLRARSARCLSLMPASASVGRLSRGSKSDPRGPAFLPPPAAPFDAIPQWRATLHQFANAALRAKADFGRINFQTAVLRLFRERPHRLSHAVNLAHFVDGPRRGNRSTCRVVSNKGNLEVHCHYLVSDDCRSSANELLSTPRSSSSPTAGAEQGDPLWLEQPHDVAMPGPPAAPRLRQPAAPPAGEAAPALGRAIDRHEHEHARGCWSSPYPGHLRRSVRRGSGRAVCRRRRRVSRRGNCWHRPGHGESSNAGSRT